MTTEEQLAWERRLAAPIAAAAFLAAVCVVAYQVIVQAAVVEDRPRITAFPDLLLGIHAHTAAFVIADVVQAVGYILLGAVLWYLFRATRHRRPELQSQFIGLVYLGPAMFALGSVLSAIDRIDLADKFAAGTPILGQAGEDRAEDLAEDASIVGALIQQVGLLSVAIVFVLVCLNAMRVGLLNRFQGIIGIVVGALFILPLFPGAPLVLETFWLVSTRRDPAEPLARRPGSGLGERGRRGLAERDAAPCPRRGRGGDRRSRRRRPPLPQRKRPRDAPRASASGARP